MLHNISSNTIYEEKIGYSRAVRVGNVIDVTATTATDGDSLLEWEMNMHKQFLFSKN